MKDKKELEVLIADKTEQLDQHDDLLTKHIQKIKTLEDQIETKAKLGEFRALEIHTKLLPTHDDIKILKDKIFDSIEQFHE